MVCVDGFGRLPSGSSKASTSPPPDPSLARHTPPISLALLELSYSSLEARIFFQHLKPLLQRAIFAENGAPAEIIYTSRLHSCDGHQPIVTTTTGGLASRIRYEYDRRRRRSMLRRILELHCWRNHGRQWLHWLSLWQWKALRLLIL